MTQHQNGLVGNAPNPTLRCGIFHFLIMAATATQPTPRRVSVSSVWNRKRRFADHLESGSLRPTCTSVPSLNLFGQMGGMCSGKICIRESLGEESQTVTSCFSATAFASSRISSPQLEPCLIQQYQIIYLAPALRRPPP